ncbi:helix-turn-helix transcriptional regulator [Clostridium sp. Marseille-Q2269]|uniref:helix-turn-helix domain-containing protein n=1 Tax=Clostridium sp. Marseille-Q2269 TaxID=2942205 RepID=UPI002074519D|nr:helix-turn-helix transcriptional regulator [Clostridium sp. Marseille-Q2269]
MNKKEQQEIIGQTLRNKRKELNLTQLEVSKAVCISRNYVSDVENGRYMPSVKVLLKLATFLKLDLNFLLDMTEIQVNI